MPENLTQIKDKVQMIDANLTFDLQLTFQDLINNLNCSKQQMARRFQLLIEQKQNSLRKQIHQINANNIKILHQKTLFFQNVNSINKNLNQKLNLKDSQISQLQHQIQKLTSQLSQLHNKLTLQQQKLKTFQTHTLQDYKRLQIVQKKYQNLLNDIEEQKNHKNQLQRRVNTLNSNTINWSDRIKYLLINRQKGLKVQYEQEITKLKDILFFYENDNKSLKDQLEREKKNSYLVKQNHIFVVNNLQKKYGVQKVSSYQNIEVQTFQNSIKRFDVAVQTYAECKQCAKINNLARHFLNKNAEIQTDEDPRRFSDSETQTIFNFLSKDDELKLIQKVKEIIKISEKQQNNYQTKINDLQKILENQPSKMQDLKEIINLQNLLSQKDKIIEKLQNQSASLKGLNSILHSQVQNLKLQTKQEKQVRIDSLQFKKKNNTFRLFTEQYPTFVNLQVPEDQMFGKTFTLQKNFSKTVDMNTTLLNFKTKRSRTSVFTPQKRTKTPNQKLTQSFIGPDQESSHWKNIEKKLKNPQLFSASPHVNAVRREKYRKFSLMKKKQSCEKQPCINFTIAF